MHMLTSQSRRISIITFLVHGLVVFFLTLATQIFRPHSALHFLDFLPLTLRSDAPARIGNANCITSLLYGCCNVRKLHELLRASRSVLWREEVEQNLLLPDGVHATKRTNTDSVLGTFTKLRKAIIISIMSVRPSDQPSVCPPGRIRLPLDEYSRNSILEEYLKYFEKIRWMLLRTRIFSTVSCR
jgi:hypothetical protein